MGCRMENAPQIDPTVPSPARIYDYLLGGKDNFPADREAAENLLRLSPNLKEGAQANRRFLIRAVEYMTQQGIRQFLDIGTGLPTQENVHQVALRHAPDSRVVYVDNDPIVLVHARALLADEKRVVAVEGDLRRPESILDNPQVTKHIDFGQPVGLLLVAVLHFIPDEAAYPAVAKLRDRLAPGSHLVISHGSVSRDLNEDVIEKGKEIYARSSAGMAIPRSREEILRFFDGFELVEPGLVPWPDDWRPREDEVRLPRLPGVDSYAGVGILR